MWFKLSLLSVSLASALSGSSVQADDSIEQFKQSWVGKTLALQRQIDINAPMNVATFIGTHNSENSIAYQIPFVRYVDPNQQISIYNQLEMGVRSIEFDIHWYTNSKFSKDILLSHALNNHVGCSAFDKPVVEGLAELRDWLQANPGEVVFLYFDRAIDGHEPRLSAYLEDYVGKYIFKPTAVRPSTHASNTCQSFPTTLSKADILKAGKQLIVVTKDCDVAAYQETDRYPAVWNDVVFAGLGNTESSRYSMLDSSYDEDFKDYPECAKHTVFSGDPEHKNIWRIFEDRTFLSSIEKPKRKILEADIKAFMRCDVNWLTMDMLTINDERLAASIWSWAANYPKPGAGECAIYQVGEGIKNVSCEMVMPSVACKKANEQTFKIVSHTVPWSQGENSCQMLLGNDWHFTTPISGGQMDVFKQAVDSQGEKQVWLNYSEDASGKWVANQ
jgi:hypothetical protein